jgi:hypothetical protein
LLVSGVVSGVVPVSLFNSHLRVITIQEKTV